MKEFDLEAAKSGKKVMTRDGRNVRIVCFDMKDPVKPIVALVEEIVHYEFPEAHDKIQEALVMYSPQGKAGDMHNDLVMATEKKVGWVNIYTEPCGDRSVIGVYPNQHEAEEDAFKGDEKAIATTKIEWEE